MILIANLLHLINYRYYKMYYINSNVSINLYEYLNQDHFILAYFKVILIQRIERANTSVVCFNHHPVA